MTQQCLVVPRHHPLRKSKQTDFLQEWGKGCPEFVAAYKLEHDMSWTPGEYIQKKEDENVMIDKILRTGTQLQLTFN